MKLSSYRVDPTAAYESELSREFAVYASAKLASGISEESSDARTLKSVVGALSTILQYYGVWFTCFVGPFTPLTFEPASDSET